MSAYEHLRPEDELAAEGQHSLSISHTAVSTLQQVYQEALAQFGPDLSPDRRERIWLDLQFQESLRGKTVAFLERSHEGSLAREVLSSADSFNELNRLMEEKYGQDWSADLRGEGLHVANF